LIDGQQSAVQAGRHVFLLCGLGVAGECNAGKKRADERTRTADLISLRVSCSTVERRARAIPQAIASSICRVPFSVNQARKRSSSSSVKRDQHPSLARPAEIVPCPHCAAATRAVDRTIPLSDLLARESVAVAIEVVGVPGRGAYRAVHLIAVYVLARRRRRSATRAGSGRSRRGR
jgi:hypothetical protein